MSFFFFNDTATTEIYTLSLHDALPICAPDRVERQRRQRRSRERQPADLGAVERDHRQRRDGGVLRSEEHTSELQSRQYLVCRLLLEKKKETSRARIAITPSRSPVSGSV